MYVYLYGYVYLCIVDDMHTYPYIHVIYTYAYYICTCMSEYIQNYRNHMKLSIFNCFDLQTSQFRRIYSPNQQTHLF